MKVIDMHSHIWLSKYENDKADILKSIEAYNIDKVVLYEENGRVLENFYKENGGTIKVISRSMCGHHPHSLDNPAIIVDFVEKYYK